MRDESELRNNLRELHTKLQQLQSVDAEEQELLGALRTEVRRLLNEPKVDDDADRHIPLSERLSVAVEDLEEQHPTLVTLMRDVSDMLSNLGI